MVTKQAWEKIPYGVSVPPKKDLTVSRPVLKYYGSKFLLAPWIASHFPKHDSLAVPFAGSLSDVLRWKPVKHTAVNDLDDNVYNFFKVLRDVPDDLIEAIKLTPWHAKEYEISKHPDEYGDPVEDARRFFYRCWMPIQGGPAPGKSSFRIRRKGSTPAAKDGWNIDHLYIVAERLKLMTFLQEDAVDFVRRFNDEEVLIYADPPYVKSTRARRKGYEHDSSDDLHVRLAQALNEHRGYVVVCGYDNDLYDELYSGWYKDSKLSRTNGSGSRVETVWMSPRTWEALEAERSEQGKLL